MRRMTSLVLVLALATAFQPATLVGAPMAERQQRAGTISGIAQISPTQPLADFTTRLRNINTGSPDDARPTKTDAAGRFTFTGVNPGAYIVEVVGPAGEIVGTSALVVTLAPGSMTATDVIVTATEQLVADALAAASAALGAAGAAAAAAAAGAAAAAAAPALAAGFIITGGTLGAVVAAAAALGITATVVANNDDASPIR
jgi:hypothetical protein